MDELTKLADKYGADKSPNIKHGYTPFYYEMFKDKRNEIKKVLEIGTAEGASLFMWRDFFPNAMIYGGEIDQKRVEMMKGQERIEVFKCDQSKYNDLKSLIKELNLPLYLDLIVDDGSHRPSDQLFTFLILKDFLRGEWTYIIEDIDQDDAFAILTIIRQTGFDCDVYEFGKRHDDRVIVVKHKNV